jgi:hypothetical protein
MTRTEAEEIITALEEWIDLHLDYRRECRRNGMSPEAMEVNDRAFLLSEAARERLIDRLAGEEVTEPMAGNGR